MIKKILKFSDDESQSESEALSSFNASRATHESSTAKSPIQSPVSVTSETEEESRDGNIYSQDLQKFL